MPQLIELPNEMLEQIIESFPPNDIDNFSLCCKRFYALSTAKFPTHKHMKRQYSYASCSKGGPGKFGFTHPIFLLQTLLEPAVIGKYVKTMCLNKCSSSRETLNTTKEIREELKAIVQSISYLTNYQKERLIVTSRYKLPGQIIALITHMLPYLQNLVIRSNRARAIHFEAIEELMVAAVIPGHRTGSMVLSKLSNVELAWPEDSGQNANSRLIHLFAGLPSMRYLRATRLIDLSGKWDAIHSNSPLTTLVLNECEIYPESLKCIIASIMALQMFSYELYLDNGEDPFEIAQEKYLKPQKPKEIVHILLQSASHSLVDLDLTDDWHRPGQMIRHGHFIGSLQGFQVLKRLRVEYRMFVEYDSWLSVRCLRVYRMIDVIPVSVESVTLTGPMMGEKGMAKLVDGLGEKKGICSLMRILNAKKGSQLKEVFCETYKSSAELGPILGLFSKIRGVEFNLIQVTAPRHQDLDDERRGAINANNIQEDTMTPNILLFFNDLALLTIGFLLPILRLLPLLKIKKAFLETFLNHTLDM